MEWFHIVHAIRDAIDFILEPGVFAVLYLGPFYLLGPGLALLLTALIILKRKWNEVDVGRFNIVGTLCFACLIVGPVLIVLACRQGWDQSRHLTAEGRKALKDQVLSRLLSQPASDNPEEWALPRYSTKDARQPN